METQQAGCFPIDPTAFPGRHDPARDLPQGEWSVIANGRIYKLDITGVTGTRVSAFFSSGDFDSGSWNSSTEAFSFVRVLPSFKQKYEAYLMHADPKDPYWRMAGMFTHYSDNALNGTQSGWYATIPRRS